ncbi:hypothetical protein ACLI09_01590 [Flavobacterium sp. RHBU_24]|uniref:hypothetical protein n=1 Tax=Flavobacterium sp. RHBU_24 TaxID=3391185 RepID=UPI00398518D8
MGKYPFTENGIKDLLQQLYSLDDEDLYEETIALSDDPCGWIAAHIELQVHQLECLRSYPNNTMRIFGWSAASLLLSRCPVEVVNISDEKLAENEASISMRSDFSYHVGTINASGEFVIKV